jgi:crotonobetainyl-CoA:carnitine CoA-transferase CaiB-like acyl-CoA transferase
MVSDAHCVNASLLQKWVNARNTYRFMKKMIRLDDIQIFVQSVEAESFSEAARRLNIAPGLASAAVLRLEKALNTRLFVRSTRSMQLSVEGERYLPYARTMLNARSQGQRALASDQDPLSGSLRLSVPSDFGRNLLLGWLDEFQRQHPALTLHVRMSDRVADLVREPLDAAVRYGPLESANESRGPVDQPRMTPQIGIISDYVAAWLETFGILQSLKRRAVEGCSYKVSVSLTRTVSLLMSLGIFDQEYAGTAANSNDEHAYIDPDPFWPIPRWASTRVWPSRWR